MSLSTNTTYRIYVEKIGAQDPSTFVGDEGELFYDPFVPTIKLSDGTTAGGVSIGGGGASSQWVTTSAGIHTTSNVGIGTTNPRFALEVGAVGASGTSLYVNGDARITGILTIGTSSITLNGSTNTINVGSGITINGATGIISATSIYVNGSSVGGGIDPIIASFIF